jgi:hypothetical protein
LPLRENASRDVWLPGVSITEVTGAH